MLVLSLTSLGFIIQTYALSFLLYHQPSLCNYPVISGRHPEACFYRGKIKIITGFLSHLLRAGKQEREISLHRELLQNDNFHSEHSN